MHARRLLAGFVSTLLLGAGVAVLPATGALADSAPLDPAAPATPVTVTADPLPTVQINGVAWSQVVVGDVVYVAGRFTSARPAGAAPGVGEVPRNNVLAYDIRTGALITSFAPSLNGQALTVTASPDGSRIYVGGDFTQVNGQPRSRIAALTPAGELVATWRPAVQGQVRAIAATNDFVYFGGNITAVGAVSRTRLAVVTAADGSLTNWAPVPGYGSTADNTDGNRTLTNEVLSMVLTNGNTQLVVSGRFDTMNGVRASGVAAIDAFTSVTRPRSEEHTSELQSRQYLVCRLLLEKKKTEPAGPPPLQDAPHPRLALTSLLLTHRTSTRAPSLPWRVYHRPILGQLNH